MKYQRREGTADGNDKYSIANQGGRCNDDEENDDDGDNGEEIDDEEQHIWKDTMTMVTTTNVIMILTSS